jgi:AcrR family transcriptional regulator
MDDEPARERILSAAEALFAQHGFTATPTSRIAERAGVPKGLVHYYFTRKSDLLEALVERLPTDHGEVEALPGELAGNLRRVVTVLDAELESSAVLSHLLWREADTHPAVLEALRDRYDRVAAAVAAVIAASVDAPRAAVDSAARLLTSALSYRHSIARHGESESMDAEIDLIVAALAAGGR